MHGVGNRRASGKGQRRGELQQPAASPKPAIIPMHPGACRNVIADPVILGFQGGPCEHVYVIERSIVSAHHAGSTDRGSIVPAGRRVTRRRAGVRVAGGLTGPCIDKDSDLRRIPEDATGGWPRGDHVATPCVSGATEQHDHGERCDPGAGQRHVARRHGPGRSQTLIRSCDGRQGGGGCFCGAIRRRCGRLVLDRLHNEGFTGSDGPFMMAGAAAHGAARPQAIIGNLIRSVATGALEIHDRPRGGSDAPSLIKAHILNYSKPEVVFYVVCAGAERRVVASRVRNGQAPTVWLNDAHAPNL